MAEFIKYPSTPNLKDTFIAIKRMFGARKFIGLDMDKNPLFSPVVLPTLTLVGTCKLHGTHGDVHMDENQNLIIQSRNRVITVEDDHVGFAKFVMENEHEFRAMLYQLIEQGKEPLISGEWAGGNIQGGVAITGMDKAFFIFNEGIAPTSSAKNIYNIKDLWSISLDLDFNDILDVQDTLQTLTLQVEANCPIGTVLNPNRTNNVGEGIVWKVYHEGKELLFFKTKGEQHKRDNKIAKPKVELPEELKEELNKFLETNVTVDRLEQGIEYLREMNLPISHQSIGTYIKWVTTDTYKESQVDLEALAKLNIDWTKNIAKVVSAMAKAYLVETISKEA